LKKFLIIIFLLCIALVSANILNIDISLSRENYGPNQNLEGVLNLNGSGYYLVDEVIEAKIKDCDSGNSEMNFTLYDILTNAGLFFGPEEEYTQGESSLTISYSSTEDNIFGFLVGEEVDELSFTLSGNGGPFFIDIGNDDENDWQYLGDWEDWDSIIYPEDFEGIDDYNSLDIIDYHVGDGVEACNDINVEFNEFLEELDLKVLVVAQRLGEIGELKAYIDGYEDCILNATNWDQISSGWVELSCNITKDLSPYSGTNNTFEICIGPSPTNNLNFIVPKYPDPNGDYYFIKLKKGLYDDQLSSNLQINDDVLTDAVNDYRFDNCGTDCLIPFKLVLGGSGTATLSSLDIKYGPNTVHNFYNVDTQISEVSLEDEEIPLSSFVDLKTPDIIRENCSLELSFDGNEDEETFSISDSSYAKIFVSSDYIAKGFEILFDASDSTIPNNVSIVSYSWQFGDGINSSISSPNHIYDSIGNYTVILTIEDSEGIISSDSVVIEVLDLEDYLDLKLPDVLNELDSVLSYFESLDGNYLKIYNLFNFDSVLSDVNSNLEGLNTNFTGTKEGNFSSAYEESAYTEIITNLNNILKETPKRINIKSFIHIENMKISLLTDIFPYVGKSELGLTEFDAYKKELYKFNQDNVIITAEFDFFDIEFLEGKKKYLFVEKDVSVSGGTNNVIVEDLRNYDLNEIYSDAEVDELNKVIFWSVSGSKIINYIVGTDEVGLINTIVFSDVSYEVSGDAAFYQFHCVNPPCDYKYCGDGYCTKDYEDKQKCPEDCGGNLPIGWFVGLAIVLIIGIVYFNIYKGPGNFKAFANKLSFSLFKRRLFVSERDRIVLRNYIVRSLQRRFSKQQIITVLLLKGWSKKQIASIFRNI